MPLTLDHVVSKPCPSRLLEDASLVTAADGEPLRVTVLPDGRTRLVYRVLEGREHGDLWITGPRSRALFKVAPGVRRMVIMPFRPGWSAPLLGVASHALTDRIVPLDDLWGRAARDVGDALAALGAHDLVVELNRVLDGRARTASEPTSDRLARRAARLLEGDAVRVTHVAEHLGVTPRHLRRAFTESVGVAPKEFARAVRLQRAVRLAASSRDWRRIASEAGYYDQAHFIGDFRDFVGLTPGAYFDDRVARPPADICASS